ncbi:hypothetical protein [Mesorhizobium caraganae]|uniref:hypothetical protein n=1 Tax=Mesorhizobium caraganae TaxID=483206 RepID=UPI003ECC957A
MKMIVYLFVTLIGFINYAAAKSCDPEAILRSDVAQYYTHDVVFLSDIQSRSFSKEQENDASIGIAYKNIPMSARDARSMSEYISEHSDFRLTGEQTTSVIKATLSDASMRAYITCLQATKGVFVVVPPSALDEEQFPFKVVWRPANLSEASPISLSVTNGELIGASAELSEPMKANEERLFTIKRDLGKTLFISAKVNGEVDTISLPRKPTFRVSIGELYYPPIGEKESQIIRGYGTNTTDLISRDLCVSSAEGGLFSSAGAAKIVAEVVDGQRRAKIEMDDANNNSRRVCGRISASSGASGIMVGIRARLHVFRAIIQ